MQGDSLKKLYYGPSGVPKLAQVLHWQCSTLCYCDILVQTDSRFIDMTDELVYQAVLTCRFK